MELKFENCSLCKKCYNYNPAGYEYHSDREGYVEARCDFGQKPNENCEFYEPTREQMIYETNVEIERLRNLLKNIINNRINADLLVKAIEEAEIFLREIEG